MDYRAYPPGPALRPWVRHYWILEGAGPASAEAIYPDGCMEIAIHLGDRFADSRGPQSESLFVGQMHSPLTVYSSGRTLCVGVKFEPGGAAAFISLPLEEFGGVVLPLEDVWGQRSYALRETLGETKTDPERIAAVELTLQAALEKRRSSGDFRAYGDPQLATAIRSLVDGEMRIDSAARLAGISTRQFQRRVRSIAGASPKLLARVGRFQRALALAQSDRPNWVEIAVHGGYFDQAHLIRDFRQFTGAPPTRFEPGSALGAT